MPPLTILIIDYKGPFTKIAKQYLSMFSVVCTVEITHNTGHVIKKVRDLQPHIVFLNPMFLGDDTMDVCNKIKEEVENIKIIEVTIFKTLFNEYAKEGGCFDGYVSREDFGDDVLPLIKKYLYETAATEIKKGSFSRKKGEKGKFVEK